MELLEQLVQTPAIPGREHRLRELIQKKVEGLFDEVRTDTLGSLICTRKPRPAGGKSIDKPLKVMLAAHMDQIGFFVKHIDDKGFLRIVSAGGFDTRNLFARMCIVCPNLKDPSKDLPGVLTAGGKPVHIASEEDKKKVPDLDEFIVDLGLPVDEVKQRVRVGDVVVLRAPMTQVGRTVVGQCLDNRIACWVLIRAMEQLKHHDCEIYAVFTVQEEVGIRGAGPATFGIEPDLGIAVDTTLCVDTPGVADEHRVTKQGAGAGLTAYDSSMIGSLELLETFERVAKDREINHQRCVLQRGGTDAAGIQRTARGVPAFVLACPTRYIHTVTEMIHLDDLHATRDVLVAYLEQAKR